MNTCEIEYCSAPAEVVRFRVCEIHNKEISGRGSTPVTNIIDDLVILIDFCHEMALAMSEANIVGDMYLIGTYQLVIEEARDIAHVLTGSQSETGWDLSQSFAAIPDTPIPPATLPAPADVMRRLAGVLERAQAVRG
jgi:hypothetical protein